MERLFALGDIHGCFKPFYELVVNEIKIQKSDQLILLGDYIDRGEQSKEVIDFIIDLQKEGFKITALTGNHELMLLNSYTDPSILTLWMMNNGMSTLQSFGIKDISDLDKRYLDFFNSLEYYSIFGDIIFVHAGFNDLDEDPFLDTHTMVWESRILYQNPALSGKTIVHGHRPKTVSYVQRAIFEKAQVIPIDTGCVYGKEGGLGMLSALEVNTMTLTSVPNY
jgi:serine/threonine protein phosphatase 1